MIEESVMYTNFYFKKEKTEYWTVTIEDLVIKMEKM